jgi:23S rRNA (cytidine2498-2'-O)-methyltransferase
VKNTDTMDTNITPAHLSTQKTSLLAQCRPGFEEDLKQELHSFLKSLDLTGTVTTKRESGFLVLSLDSFLDFKSQLGEKFCKLLISCVFARQIHLCLGVLKNLPERNKTDILASYYVKNLETWNQTWGDSIGVPLHSQNNAEFGVFSIDHPDTNEGRSLQKLAASFPKYFAKSLEQFGKNADAFPITLFFEDWKCVHILIPIPKVTVGDSMGIPRLKFPAAAPSRSTLKLEEAFHFFLSPHRRDNLLRSGMTAVDLGASPGGWTFQFAKRQIRTLAIDNGPMDQNLLDTGLVEHVRADGFTYKPQKSFHWMVCDIVDKPSRTVDLVINWAERGWAEQFVFNLKLPMKKRFEEYQKLSALLQKKLDALGCDYYFRARQLYFDRDEVTCYLNLPPAKEQRR